ncbi:MAG: MATE family efflux transporter [Firmicutes bacterium HGW-Firmicutes-1]|jgi:putative MATE family efflux protein|nr:MAG: MATE family efflux transporter [Firmicutes bacterium HGW-Firmicutes-15]PKM93783.1 MAG: MATE family efflux transporter [Firmicutes bacterium HGW-Firmicutes-1]
MELQLKTNVLKGFYKQMVILGLPIMIQNLVSTSLNMVDTIMISSQGEQALAAVAIANKFLFIMLVIMFGINSGTSIFISQYYGANDHKNIQSVLGMGIILGTGVCAVFFGLAFLTPEMVMAVFIKDAKVIELGSSYLRIVSISYLAMTLTFAFSNASRCVHRTKVPMIGSIISILLNTFINYLLIEGHFGFPSLGVEGAAIATFISRLLEFVILMCFIYLDRTHPLNGKIRELFVFSRELFNKILKTILPVIINEGLWVVGTSVYYIAYGKLGASSMAAMQISMTLTDLCWAIFTGFGGAAAVLIGNVIGRGDDKIAFTYAKMTLKAGVLMAILIGILMIAISPFLNVILDLSEDTLKLAMSCVVVMSIYLPIRNFNYIMFISVLRSGGDTTYCMIVDAITVWVIGVPATFAAVYFLPISIPLLIGVSYFEEVVKAVIVYKRFVTKKWIHVLVTP